MAKYTELILIALLVLSQVFLILGVARNPLLESSLLGASQIAMRRSPTVNRLMKNLDQPQQMQPTPSRLLTTARPQVESKINLLSKFLSQKMQQSAPEPKLKLE